MSHDRGCPCGRERYEYEDCTDPNCYKKDLVEHWKKTREALQIRREVLERPTTMTTEPDMKHMDQIAHVVSADLRALHEKEATYRGSWKRRGGVGAWMMAARKIDRLETMLDGVLNYDVFAAIGHHPDGDDGTVLAEIRDLRRYLTLIEAEMVARGVVRLLPAVPERCDLVADEEMTGGSLARASGSENPRGYDPEVDDPPRPISPKPL